MSSWITCRCGRQLHTNLACGCDLRLVIHEAVLEAPREHLTAEQVVASVVLSSPIPLRTLTGCAAWTSNGISDRDFLDALCRWLGPERVG